MSRPKPAEVASQTETSETCRGEGCLGLFSGAGAGSRERRKTAKDATGLPGSHALRRTRRWCVCTLHRQTAGPLVALQSPHSRRAMRAKTGRCRQKRKRHGRAEGNTSVERRKKQTRRGTPARPTSKRSGQDHPWLSMEIKDDCFDTEPSKSNRRCPLYGWELGWKARSEERSRCSTPCRFPARVLSNPCRIHH